MSFFKLKEIEYFNRKVKILCQNLNGPCPLLSLCNVLILSGKINIHSDYEQVSLDMITQLIANELLEKEHSHEMSTEMKVLHQERLGVAISMLPSLQRGLDVNVKFNDVSSFEYTRELDCFDSFSVPLYHGWIYDPQDRDTKDVIQEMTYNHLLFKLVEVKGLAEEEETVEENKNDHEHDRTLEQKALLTDDSKDNDAGDQTIGETTETKEVISHTQRNKNTTLRQEAKVIEDFLAETASQLTYAGLLSLHDTIPEGNLCSFFRNNHFSTMLKREKSLYLLVTDLGYADKSNIVWELLDEIDGNTELVDSHFRPIFSSDASKSGSGSGVLTPAGSSNCTSVSTTTPIIDPDYLLALQLSGEQPSGVQQCGQQGQTSSQHIAGTVGYASPPASSSSSSSAPPPSRTQQQHPPPQQHQSQHQSQQQYQQQQYQQQQYQQQQHQQHQHQQHQHQQHQSQQQVTAIKDDVQEESMPVTISSCPPSLHLSSAPPSDFFEEQGGHNNSKNNSNNSSNNDNNNSNNDNDSGTNINYYHKNSSPTCTLPGLTQEERDRQTALQLHASLQQEDHTSSAAFTTADHNYNGDVHHLQQSLSPAELDAYRQAEMNYFRNRDNPPPGLSPQQRQQQQQHYDDIQRRAHRRKEKKEQSSGCIIA